MYQIIFNMFMMFTMFISIYLINIVYSKYLKINKMLTKSNMKTISLVGACHLGYTMAKGLGKLYFTRKIQQYIQGFCIKKIDNNFEVTLVIQNKLCKFLVKINKKPSQFIQILDSNNEIGDNNDIKQNIQSYLAIEQVQVTPELLGYSDLDCYMISGDVINLKKGDKIENLKNMI